MNLLEYQAKHLLAEQGIPIPHGVLIDDPADLDRISYPTVIKAQIPVGGRGKAGAVQVAHHKGEAHEIAANLRGKEIKGYGINTLLAEDAVPIRREVYIACLNDKTDNRPMFVYSRAGGVDIERLAQESPHQVMHKKIDPLVGPLAFDLRHIATQLRIKADRVFHEILDGMWRILREQDATLVEINPLALTDSGPVALDAKIVLDDNADFRHRDQRRGFASDQAGRIVRRQTRAERLAERYDITYVPLEGDVGIIADGAGTGMLTLDLVKDLGGEPANFCEMGGKAAAEAAGQAMEIVLANPGVKKLLISLIGGLTRMDQVAEGIAAYLQKNGSAVPVWVRMCGTKTEEGRHILAAQGIETRADLLDTVKQAIRS